MCRKTEGGFPLNIPAKERIDREFKNLLKDSGIEKIKITDICRAAQINRTTFYEYYHSKSELLCALQMEYFNAMYDSFAEEYKNALSAADAKKFFLKVVRYHKEHSEDFAYLLKNNADGLFETNLSMHLKQKILGANYSKKDEFEFIYHFIGHLAMISSWILEGMSLSEEELADIMMKSVPMGNGHECKK